jgi:hypothetical protein
VPHLPLVLRILRNILESVVGLAKFAAHLAGCKSLAFALPEHMSLKMSAWILFQPRLSPFCRIPFYYLFKIAVIVYLFHPTTEGHKKLKDFIIKVRLQASFRMSWKAVCGRSTGHELCSRIASRGIKHTG